VQALLTGETKGNDTLNGVKGNDTAITALYVGPAVKATWKSNLGFEFGADIPTIQNNSSVQIVPNFRLRLGGVWRF